MVPADGQVSKAELLTEFDTPGSGVALANISTGRWFDVTGCKQQDFDTAIEQCLPELLSERAVISAQTKASIDVKFSISNIQRANITDTLHYY